MDMYNIDIICNVHVFFATWQDLMICAAYLLNAPDSSLCDIHFLNKPNKVTFNGMECVIDIKIECKIKNGMTSVVVDPIKQCMKSGIIDMF